MERDSGLITNQALGFIFNQVVSAISDSALASLPIVFMWKVQMIFKIKAGICALMGMGFL